MQKQKAIQEYFNALHDVSRDRANAIVDELLQNEVKPETIVFDIISPVLEKMVQEFMNGNVILSQHFVGTKISDEIIDRLLPEFSSTEGKKMKVIIGCAQGDFHGLGKKIVIGSLKANFIEPIDLGLNVMAEDFVQEAVKNEASVIGVSAMMVHTAIGENGAKKVREILRLENLEPKIKLIVGGAPYKFDSDLFKQVEADDWAANGIEAVHKIRDLNNAITK